MNIIRPNRWKVDLTNQKFGKLTCIERAHKVGRHFTWKCLCECGNTTYPYQTHLLRGNTKTCGCSQSISGELHKDWKGYGEISGNIWNAIQRVRPKNENREFLITIKYAWELFLKQDRKCSLSGMPIFFNVKHGEERTASLDRIDSSKGYIEGNVQWVHKHINIMKNKYDQQYFIELCRLVSNCAGGQCELV